MSLKPVKAKNKYPRRQLPPGTGPTDFVYIGKPSVDQGDYLIGSGRTATVNTSIGIADMACVNQFGEANNSKGYHAGVVKNTKTGEYHLYTEWGRCRAGKSWQGGVWSGAFQDYQFTHGGTLAEAQAWFAFQVNDKNLKRLSRQTVGGVDIWCAKKGKDGYLIQDLATREKGLPDILTVKNGEGVQDQPATKAAKAPAVVKPSRSFQPEVVSLATALVGGTKTYTRALSAATGVTPTMRSILKVRDQLIPAALERLAAVGTDFPDQGALVAAQVQDSALRAISKTVSSLIPRPLPRAGVEASQAILNSDNIFALQQDLDTFEAALAAEDFTASTPASTVDPDGLLNATLRYIDPNSSEGAWLWGAFVHMSNNRHGYLGRKTPRVRSLFAVERSDRDARFMANVKKVGQRVRGQVALRANLQPKRTDLAGLADDYSLANVVMSIHGTRPVNIAPIMGTNFRMPKSLPGAQITGANFGHGIYFATDWRKSYGYTGRGYYGGGGAGGVAQRGCFMFINDMIMGQAYRAPSTGSWDKPPMSCNWCHRPAPMRGRYSQGACRCPGDQVQSDSVFGVGGDTGHRLQNDEHIIFSPDYQCIRYLVEVTDWAERPDLAMRRRCLATMMFTPKGQMWPRLSISVRRNEYGGFIVTCSQKLNPDGWWGDSGIPWKLAPVVSKLIAEAKKSTFGR